LVSGIASKANFLQRFNDVHQFGCVNINITFVRGIAKDSGITPALGKPALAKLCRSAEMNVGAVIDLPILAGQEYSNAILQIKKCPSFEASNRHLQHGRA
jgi:hypothetical protein